jgi:hypothetical protein
VEWRGCRRWLRVCVFLIPGLVRKFFFGLVGRELLLTGPRGFFFGREEEGRRKESAEVMFIKDFVVSCNVFFSAEKHAG